MRAELPWNVAGIPPEAREAARAAARREGLSVGEWLTRRIIAELGEDAAPHLNFDELGTDLAPAGSHPQTDAMLARLAQAEADASDTYRRIEAQLRVVGTGLDNAGRSQSESHRAMSRAATEITLASQEQAEAFDQLGRHMASLDGRMQKMERAALQDGLREAVKGLHLGLSRLADQFGQATARSGGQVTSLARNLEQLALRLVQARADAEAAAQALQSHLAQMEETHHFTNGTIEQILGRMDAQAETHDQDLLETRQYAAVQQSTLAMIEDRLAVLEEPDPAMAERLDAIEQDLAAIREALEQPDPHAHLAETLHQIALRLDMVEQNHNDILTELQAGLARIPELAPEKPGEEIAMPEPVGVAAASEPVITAEKDVPVPSLPQEIPAGPAPQAAADNFVPEIFPAHFEMPQDFARALTQPPQADEQALFNNIRRTVQEAAPADTERKRPSHLVVLAVLFFLLLGAAAALMLRERAVRPVAPPKPLPHHVAMANPSPIRWTPRPAQPPAPPAVVPVAPATPIEAKAEMSAAPASSANRIQAAADSGNEAAETIVGLKALEKDDAVAAFQWLQKAALHGQPVAQYRLGTLYERGQGTSTDHRLAVKWYLAAATQGNRRAMHNLAVAYADGSGGEKNMAEAARWFAQAAALGLSDSQFNLAVLYERGEGVPQNLAESYKWYAIAAASGDTESRARLAVLQTQLSDAERADAEGAARNFRSQPFNRIANVPPQAGDIGS